MLKTHLRTLIRNATGYDVHKLEPGRDAIYDIRRLINSANPVIFDIGANVGQTIDRVLGAIPSAVIHAFEPGETAFKSLSETHSSRALLNNIALGSTACRQQFFENSSSDMSSFLPLAAGWGSVSATRQVDVSTVDHYCETNKIDRIDLLKSDTQGFELEVLHGANRMLQNTTCIYLELTFANLYKNLPRPDEVMSLLAKSGFELVSFYKFSYINDRAGWTDALFVRQPRNCK